MACCGKTRPLGSKGTTPKSATPKNQKSAEQKSAEQKKVSRTPTASSFQRFTLEQRDGTTQTFGSRLEAGAARIRSGGGTVR